MLGKDYAEVNWPALMTWEIGPKTSKIYLADAMQQPG